MASQTLAVPLYDAADSTHVNGVLSPTLVPSPAVLLVDDDPEAGSHCSKMLEYLGYPYHCATNPRDALRHLDRDPAIQIILVNINMGPIDGFALIEEARARAGGGKPVAAILLAEQASTELAVKGLHIEAVDLLSKPVDFSACSAALRRATAYLSARRAAGDSNGLSGFSAQLARIISTLEKGASQPKVGGKPTESDISATLRALIDVRALRSRFFPNHPFADPAWDIMLDLAKAKLEGKQISVSSACIAASVPMSTALRWIRQMAERGLLRRWTDPEDRRRDLIALPDSTVEQMHDFLTAATEMMRKI